jgi:hypothetical protein
MPLTRPLYAFRWDKLHHEINNQHPEFFAIGIKGTVPHCNENPTYVFLFWKYCGLSPMCL